ncbi:N-formylglutamate amidohydrolase [Azospirillum brasilense]|uniref:N-formylglutamate amidohydrolase n=1 Tax=Azospirillum brasilense TaxID=192 RepID=UPI000E67E21E|nr:N-formylglutamate amidohydrolase [Azospirillum brasilense]NUB26104.1 N-formylglutamate amidohydrolase [Azospirillum brasilense]NUB32662.1 N-formylglutamate amidohydrolase [Azospirillum brasilense]RIW05922.1 N-formylglutamate amidohydrolase [Azospirillum brasilense]
MSFVIEDVLVRNDPIVPRLPVFFDSPHSGTVYPRDFAFVCPASTLRQAEDTHVDELFAHAPEHGATLLCALFPRTYIDANRAIDDIDPAILDGRWPEPLRPTEKSAAGMGLIRTLCRPGMPLYDGRLSVAEVAERIDRYYRPYHFQVASVMDDLADRFGAVWHIDCHSMPSAVGPGAAHKLGMDFVLGDRDGTSCEPGFTALVEGVLTGLGYKVTRNHPFKGVELVSRHSNPARGRHSLQLEINRRLYMNEETLERNEGFARLQANLTTLTRRICAHAQASTARRAAE